MVFYSNMYCSILTMMAIGIDRYLGIVKPMAFRKNRWRKSIAVFSCLLMWCLVLGVLYPLMTTDLTYDIHELKIVTCFDVLKKNMLPSVAAWASFLFSLVFVLFFFPLCVTTFCYVSVILKLSRDSKTAQKNRAIRLAVVVLIVFVVCFAPNNILLLLHSVFRLFYDKSLYMAYKLSLCFSCLNSCLDPFIYYFASKDFRMKLRQIMNLQSTSSADSMKMENKETLFSAQWDFKTSWYLLILQWIKGLEKGSICESSYNIFSSVIFQNLLWLFISLIKNRKVGNWLKRLLLHLFFWDSKINITCHTYYLLCSKLVSELL